MASARVSVMSLLAAATVIVTGCGGSDKPTAKPTPSSSSSAVTPCGQACSGKEVTTTHCDPGAEYAIKPVHVKIKGVEGDLSLRQNNPAQSTCDHIYWTRLVLDKGSEGAFELTTWVNGKPSLAQKSAPGNDTLTAWTVGMYAKPGTAIKACLRALGSISTPKWKCLSTTSV